AADAELARRELDVSPAKREHLGSTASRGREHPEVERELGVDLDRRDEEVAERVDRGRDDLALARLRDRRVSGHVPSNKAPPARLVERLADDRVAQPHRPGRQLATGAGAAGAEPGVPAVEIKGADLVERKRAERRGDVGVRDPAVAGERG